MWEIASQILVIVGLSIANGILAMSEMAVVSARKARLQHRVEEGDPRARVALELAMHPDRFLSTVQVGITLVGVVAGAYGGVTLARSLAEMLGGVAWLGGYADAVALGIVVLGTTYLSLVVGELVPKQIALNHPEAIATAVGRPMRGLSILAYPAVRVLSASSNLVLRLMRVRPVREPPVTQEEIRILVEQGGRAGVFERTEQALVERVLALGERRVSSLMTPRSDIIWIDIDAPIGESMRTMSAAGHTYFPVCRGGIDHVLGLVSVKEQWARMVNRQPPDLRAGLVAPVYVPETMTAVRLLETLKQNRRHLALVIDEFGGISGLVTTADVLEAIVGDIPTGPGEQDQSVVRRQDGSWLIDGALAVEEMKRVLELAELPEDGGEYQTVGGFCMARLGRIPRIADSFEWSGLRFEIVDMDGHRVDKVLVVPLPAAPPTSGPAPD